MASASPIKQAARSTSSAFAGLSALSLLALSVVPALAEKLDLPAPTQEELKMTVQPQVPGAGAVMLYHEEVTDSFEATYTVLSSIKILNDSGRDKYGTVSIEHPASRWAGLFGFSQGMKVDKVAARTIHADGKIVEFTGKPFERDVTKSHSETIREAVIAFPDVQVGSILQYRYTLHTDAMYFVPTWFARSDLFIRREHFSWHTLSPSIGYTSTLAGGAAAVKADAKHGEFSTDLSDIMPEPAEPFMAPSHSLDPKVVFYTFASEKLHSVDSYWSETGSFWSKTTDELIGPPSLLKKQASEMTQGAVTPEEKVRKIYAAMMMLENTRFARKHTAAEDKANGVAEVKSIADILRNRRGNDDEIALLFVGLVRAAGLKAYAMDVTARDKGIFFRGWLSYSQFDDYIAIVEINGKEQFFDPGQRFCPYGLLKWTHTGVTGIRQTATGAEIVATPGSEFSQSLMKRIGDLSIDRSGKVSGLVTITLTGARALRWRQTGLLEDEIALHKDLEDFIKEDLPHDVELTIDSITNLKEYEQPLVIKFNVKGTFATATSRRVVFPNQFFEVGEQNPFSSETRATPVYFQFPEQIADAVRVRFPATLEVEFQPKTETFTLPAMAVYKSSSVATDTSITVQRNYVEGTILASTAKYPELRTFFANMVAADQEPITLRVRPDGAQ